MSQKDKPKAQESQSRPHQGPPKKEGKRSTLNDTGLHVVKGALVKVLGPSAKLTTSVEFETPTKAILTVEYGDNVSDPQKQQIQDECNKLIQADLPIQQFTLPRAEAETKYTANPVNHTYIYDKFPVPAKIKDLTIIEIKDWNVNCCPSQHCARTGELLGIFIQKARHKQKNNTLEVQFLVGQPAVDSLTGKKSTTGGGGKLQKVKIDEKDKEVPAQAPASSSGDAASKASKSKAADRKAQAEPSSSGADSKLFGGWKPGSKSVLQSGIDELVDDAASILSSLGVEADKIDLFKQKYQMRVETVLGNVQNQAYASGFTSHAFQVPKFFP